MEAVGNDPWETLLPLGRVLSRLPVDVTIGKILVLGTIFHVIEPLLTIAAAVSVQSPFLRNASEEAVTNRNSFLSEHGDPFTLLNLYDEWIFLKTRTKDNTRRWCRRHGVEEQRLYEISKLRNQFKGLLKDYRLIQEDEEEEEEKGNFFGHQMKSRELKHKKRELRKLQMEREKSKERRVFSFEDIDQTTNEKDGIVYMSITIRR